MVPPASAVTFTLKVLSNTANGASNAGVLVSVSVIDASLASRYSTVALALFTVGVSVIELTLFSTNAV